MATCRGCGAEIVWGRTEGGSPMPLNPDEFPFMERTGGKDIAITADGSVIRGDLVSDSCESGYVLARISHFATCPNAKQHRRMTR